MKEMKRNEKQLNENRSELCRNIRDQMKRQVKLKKVQGCDRGGDGQVK